ncbi:MAG: enoyl-CoA hydratase [Deltaproteobacteria bacterium]|nr:MAG: enoyl-CoA hydratase [Deltaproteobacteria bacterium]
MKTSENIKIIKESSVLKIVIDRPEALNALTSEMYDAMSDALEEADVDPEVRAILIHGNESCFTSGNDLLDFKERPEDAAKSAFCFMVTVSQLTKPIVAAVTGPAVGIGTTILLHHDLVVAGESTSFMLPFVNLGVCPEAGASYLLPRMLGHVKAAELLLLGEPFSATAAREMGIINEIVPDNDVFTRGMELALKLASKPPAALRLSKSLIKKHSDGRLNDIIKDEGDLFLSLLTAPEAKEAFAAFAEKRKPDFSKFS